jgi:NADH dehydrogenase FAD-containing subunit
VRDAERLREAIGNTLERANIPDMSDEERTRTLTFVVVGAGPTGVELTAELKDFIEEDCPRFYPHLLPYIRIKVYLFLRLFFFEGWPIIPLLLLYDRIKVLEAALY